MSGLLLDALFPPGPLALVIDCQAVGARGAFAYVSRPGGGGNWTPAHVDALRAAGLVSIPIIVPSPAGADPGVLLSRVRAFGFQGGPITLDLEPPNLPPAGWEEQFDQAARAAGFVDFDYGTPSNLGLYQPDDQEWKATWIRTGVLDPVPQLPPSWDGWQFVNDVVIRGTFYDASVISDRILAEAKPPMTPEEHALLQVVYNLLVFGHSSTPAGDVWLWGISDGTPGGSKVDAIAANVAKLVTAAGGPGGLSVDQAAQLKSCADALVRIEHALQTA